MRGGVRAWCTRGREGRLGRGRGGGRCVECRPPTHTVRRGHAGTEPRAAGRRCFCRCSAPGPPGRTVSSATSQGSHFPGAVRTLDLWAELGGKRAAFPRFSVPPPHCSPCLGGATLLTCTSSFSVAGWSGPSFQSPKGRRRRRQARSLPGCPPPPPAYSGAGPAAAPGRVPGRSCSPGS